MDEDAESDGHEEGPAAGSLDAPDRGVVKLNAEDIEERGPASFDRTLLAARLPRLRRVACGRVGVCVVGPGAHACTLAHNNPAASAF